MIFRSQRSALLICDIQDKFRPNISFFPEIVSNSHRVMQVHIFSVEQEKRNLQKFRARVYHGFGQAELDALC